MYETLRQCIMLLLTDEVFGVAYFVLNKVSFLSKAAKEKQMLEIATNRSWAPVPCKERL
jgi:hypothetical protein